MSDEDFEDEYQQVEQEAFRALWDALKEAGVPTDSPKVDRAISDYADAVQMLGHMNGV